MERMNRILFEMVWLLLIDVGLFIYFWEYVILIVVYIRNRGIIMVDNKRILEEIFIGKKLYIKYLRVFGCDVYMYI